MDEADSHEAIGQKFSAAIGWLAHITSPNERVTALVITVGDLLLDTGLVWLSHVPDHGTYQVTQVNVVRSSGGLIFARDEAVVAAVNLLCNRLQAEHAGAPNEFVVIRQIGGNVILVFRTA